MPIDTDAAAATVVVAVAALSEASGSFAPDPADAVLLSTVPATTPEPTCTVSVTVADAPLARAPRLHVTVVVPPHDPCEGVADTNDVPAGCVSVIVTPGASDGPVFVTPIAYVRSVPAVTGSGESVFVTARSADAATVVVAVAALSEASGSVTAELADAALLSTVPAATPSPTCTVSVTVAAVPLARAPRLHVTVVIPLHVPCDGAAVTNDVPAGSVSVSETAPTSDGPVFATPIV